MPRCLDIHASRIGEVRSRLQDGRTLPLIDADFLDVVQRELPEVDDAVLCIAQLDAVVIDAHML